MSHLFLSYSHKDRRVVERLADILEKRGERIWWDRRLSEAIAPHGWRNEIADKLFECRAMIVIVTEHAFNSPDVHREVEVVLSAAKKPIVPLWVGSPQPAPGRRGLLYALSVHQRLQVCDIDSLNDIAECVCKILEQLGEPQVADRAALPPHSLHSLSLPRISVDQEVYDEAQRLISRCQTDRAALRECAIKGVRDSIDAGAWTRANSIIDQMREAKVYLSESDGKLARMVEWHAWYMRLVDKGQAASIREVLKEAPRQTSAVVGDMPERIRDVIRKGWFALIEGGLGEIYSALALPPQRAAAIKLDVMELLAYADTHRDVLGLVLGHEQLPDPAITSLVPRVVNAYRSSGEVSGPSLEVLRATWPPSAQRDALERAVEDARRTREIAQDTTRVLDEFARCSSPEPRSQNLEFLRDQLRRQADLQRFSRLDRLKNALLAWDSAMDDIARGDFRSAVSTLDGAIEFDGVGAFRDQLAETVAASDRIEAERELTPTRLVPLAERWHLALEGLAASAGLAREAPHAYAAIEAARTEAAAESNLLSAFADCPDRVCPWGQEAAVLERALRDLAGRPGRATTIGLAWANVLETIRNTAASTGNPSAGDGWLDLTELPEIFDAARSPVAVLKWLKRPSKHTAAFESVLKRTEDAFATLIMTLRRAELTSVVSRAATNLAVAWREGVTEAKKIGRAASQVRVALRSKAYDDAVTELRRSLPSAGDADQIIRVFEEMRVAEQEISARPKTGAGSAPAAADTQWSTRSETPERQRDGAFLECALDDCAQELADSVTDDTIAVAIRKRLADVRAALSDGDFARARGLLERIAPPGLAADVAWIMWPWFEVPTALGLALARERVHTLEERIYSRPGDSPDPAVVDAEEHRVLEPERALSKVPLTRHANWLLLRYHDAELAECSTRIECVSAYGQMADEVRDFAASHARKDASQKTPEFLEADDSDLADEAWPLLDAVQPGHDLATPTTENEPVLKRLLAEREKDQWHPMLASWADQHRTEGTSHSHAVKDDEQSAGDDPATESYRDNRCAADAYTLMTPFGVSPSSSAAAIHRAGLKAQKSNGRSGDITGAWRELRNIEKRLALDLLYQQPGGITGQGSVSAEPGVSLPEPPPLDLPAPGPLDLAVFPALVPAPTIPGAITLEVTPPAIDLPVWDLAIDLVARLPATAVVIDLPDSFLDHPEEER